MSKALSFAIRMALRELRRGWRRFLFFLLCIAIGIAGLVGLRGFNINLQRALLREARTLMAADMQVSMNRPATDAQKQKLTEMAGRGITVMQKTETVSVAVNPVNTETRLVEVKAVEAGYPWYGVLEMAPAGDLRDDTALVGPDLLDYLGVKVGDSFRLGSASFTITGVITKEPDKILAGFSIGPRVLINQAGLERAKLIQVGSRARYSYLVKLPEDAAVEPVRAELTTLFASQRPSVMDFREANPRTKELLDRVTSFLSLISMVALLVGGLGVASAARVFIQQKLDAIAIMKCVGATNRKVLAVYLTQMIMLGILGSLLGIMVGYAIQLAMPFVVKQVGVTVDMNFSPVAALQGGAVGVITSILFTLLPLSSIGQVKPAHVFRRDIAGAQPFSWRQRLTQFGLLAAIGLGLVLISAWVSGSLTWGFYFMGGVLVSVIALNVTAAGALRLYKLITPSRRWVALRQGVSNLYRPGSQSTTIVLGLGIGMTLVLATYLLQANLMREVQLSAPPDVPNMFFQGVETSNVERFKEFLQAAPGVQSAPEPTPIAQAKVLKVNGKTKEELTLSGDQERFFNNDFTITYAATPPAGNEIVTGRWWTESDYKGKLPLLSVEQRAADRLHLVEGSTVEMQIAGDSTVTGVVYNIRKTIDYRAGGGFNFIFSPGGLGNAPVTFMAQARVKPDAVKNIRRETVTRFPGVTPIDVGEILESIRTVIDQIGLVIRFVAGFSVVAGLIILASAIVSTKFRRVRDAVLYKTLGATRGRVWRIFGTEYALLGLTAGVVGAVLASLSTWAVLHFVMQIKYTFAVVPLLAGVGVTVLLTTVVGVLSTVDVVNAKPLQVLREE